MHNNATLYSYILSWFFLILCVFPIYTLYLKNDEEDLYAPAMVCIFTIIIRIIPLTSFLFYNPQNLSFIIQEFIFWTFFFLLILNFKPFSFGSIINITFIVDLVSIVCSLVVLYVSFVYAGFRIHLSLEDIYLLRMEARGYNMPTLLQYAHSASSNLVPICIVYYILKRKPAFIFFLVFIGILNFSIAGHKSTLFKILLCLGLFYARKTDFKKVLLPIIIVLLLFCVLEFSIFNTNSIATIVVRRMFYMPNLLDSLFFSYVDSDNPLLFDSSAYSKLQFQIGDYFFGSEDMRANNGFFSDAYANLGRLGCFVYPLIYSIIFRALFGAVANLHKAFVVYSSLLFVLTLGSSSFTTSLLTHGLFALFVLLLLMPRQDEDESEDEFEDDAITD